MEINEEEILKTINDNIHYYDLLSLNRFINLISDDLVHLYNAYSKLPKFVVLRSTVKTPIEIQTEVLRSLYEIDKELSVELYEIFSGYNPEKVFQHIADEEDLDYGDDKCIDIEGELKVMRVTVNYNTYDYARLAHESGHILSAYRTTSNGQLTSEIESMFLENIISLDLIERGIITQEDYDRQSRANCLALRSYLMNILGQNDVLNSMNFPVKAEDLIRVNQIYSGTPKFRFIIKAVNDLTTPDTFELMNYCIRYVVGDVISHHMIKAYKDNKKAVMERYKEYLKSDCDFNIEEACEYLTGMKFEEALKIYTQDINNDRRLYRR